MKDNLARAFQALVPYRPFLMGLALLAFAISAWYEWVLYTDFAISPNWWLQVGIHSMLIFAIVLWIIGLRLNKRPANEGV